MLYGMTIRQSSYLANNTRQVLIFVLCVLLLIARQYEYIMCYLFLRLYIFPTSLPSKPSYLTLIYEPRYILPPRIYIYANPEQRTSTTSLTNFFFCGPTHTVFNIQPRPYFLFALLIRVTFDAPYSM